MRSHRMYAKPEYNSWFNMKQRCLNPKNSSFERYGERGITFCEEWGTLENFYADMGNKPGPGYSLERIDNSLGYCKANCKWATAEEQSNNRRPRRWYKRPMEIHA